MPTIPVTFTAGSVLEANQLNSNFTSVFPTFTAYTPTLTGWTQGNATFETKYATGGETVDYQGYLTFGSTSAVTASTPTVTLPANAQTAGITNFLGICAFNDVSAGVAVTGYCRITATGTMSFFWHDPETVPLAVRLEPWSTAATMPFTFATGDYIYWSIRYEKA